MICRCSLVFVLSLIPLVVLCEEIKLRVDVECGKGTNKYIQCHKCDSNINISETQLKRNDAILRMEHTAHDEKCSERFCLKVDGKSVTLTILDATYADEGPYELYITQLNKNIESPSILVYVDACEPIISRSDDSLMCKVTMKSDNNPTIQWMSEEKGKYTQSTQTERKETDVYTTWETTINQTEETRKTPMCCKVSYTINETQRREKLTCLPTTAEIQSMNEEKTGRSTVVVPILCVILLAVAVALYMNRHRMPSTWMKRKNTEEEDPEATQLENLPESPDDKV